MESIVEAVGAEFGCNEGDVLVKGRKKNKAGEIAVYIARDLGTYFNGISGAAITMRYKQAAKEIVNDKRLRRKVNRIKECMFNFKMCP